MKFLIWGLVLVGSACGAGLHDVRSVYLFPMTNGFDQHLANWLVGEHVFQVVSDPKLADAVMTDQISPAFLYKLDHIDKKPVPVPSGSGLVDEAPREFRSGYGRGTVFLVDAKSKEVLWSMYQLPKNATSRALDKTAKKVITSLGETLNAGNEPPATWPAAVAPVTPVPALAPPAAVAQPPVSAPVKTVPPAPAPLTATPAIKPVK